MQNLRHVQYGTSAVPVAPVQSGFLRLIVHIKNKKIMVNLGELGVLVRCRYGWCFADSAKLGHVFLVKYPA